MRRLKTCIITVLIVFTFSGSTTAGTTDSARAVVETFQAGLLAVMKEADGLSVRERYDRLRPLIADTYYTALMIRIATGDYWDKASDDQKRQLIDGFARMGTSTLATLFGGYSGETFRILDETPSAQQTVVVATHIERPGKKPVAINYITRRYNDRWYIIDVLLDKDISELRIRQSEYRAILRSDGVDGLIATLNSKADELLSNNK